MSGHFLIMAGGTGGHVMPGLSVANELMSRGHTVSWMGTRTGIEARLVPEANIAIDYIDISGVRGKGKLSLLRAPINIIRAMLQARSFIKQRKPVAVLGMGGFVAGPGGMAARLMGLPVLIHEQNAKAGTTNKILSRVATKVLQAFPHAFLGGRKFETVGNPVRRELQLEPKVINAGTKLNVLVLGGSLGALAINEVMPSVFNQLSQKINIWHQAGSRHTDAVEQSYKSTVSGNDDYKVTSFIDDMAEAYQWADVVICRSGAMTVSELACASKPAIFVPFPFAIDDHQTANAHWMVDAGAAILISQQTMSEEILVSTLEGLLSDSGKINAMAAAAKVIRITDASERVADYCESSAMEVQA